KLRIVFDNPPPGLISEQAYERAVALAASFAFHFTQENTDTSFTAPGYAGGSELYNFLSYLAVVEPWKGDSILDTLPVSDDYNLVLTARPPGSVPSALSASSYFLLLHQRSRSQATPPNPALLSPLRKFADRDIAAGPMHESS